MDQVAPIAQERLLEFFRGEGLSITEPDVGAVRAHIQDACLASEFPAHWPEGLLDRINAAE